MIEPLLDRVRELEKSNREWKTVTTILAAVLLAVMLPGTVFVGIQGYRLHIERQHMRAVLLEEEEKLAAVIEQAAAAQKALAAKKE